METPRIIPIAQVTTEFGMLQQQHILTRCGIAKHIAGDTVTMLVGIRNNVEENANVLVIVAPPGTRQKAQLTLDNVCGTDVMNYLLEAGLLPDHPELARIKHAFAEFESFNEDVDDLTPKLTQALIKQQGQFQNALYQVLKDANLDRYVLVNREIHVGLGKVSIVLTAVDPELIEVDEQNLALRYWWQRRKEPRVRLGLLFVRLVGLIGNRK